MNHRDKGSSYPSRKRRNSGGSRASRKNGYALLIVMMMATLLLISLTAALPNIYVEGQREQEEELIFRGEQYAQAIARFHKQFNRYPTSIKELLHTNQMSFLRQAYRDPMSKSGRWRFIHATANGVILDSKLLSPQGQQNTPNGGGSSTGAPQTGQAAPGTTYGQNTPGSEGFSLFGNQGPGTTSGQNMPGSGGFSLSGSQGSGALSGSGQQGTQGSSMFGGQNQLVGAYIVGVASTSTKTSIRVFEGRTHYDEWEFLGVPGAPGGPEATLPGGVPSLQEQAPSTGLTPQPGPTQNSNSIFGGTSNSP
jgi:hypothetical protein